VARRQGRIVRYVAGVIAFTMMVAFLSVAVVKLKDPALAIVMLIGVGLMAWDLWGSLRERERDD
jgi:threonine/homoserine/homoserine lactone efflux protein